MKHFLVLAVAAVLAAGCARDRDDDRDTMRDGGPRDNSRAPSSSMQVKDQVCGMTCDRNNARSYEYNGKVYYFCSDDCRGKFKNSPDTYIASR